MADEFDQLLPCSWRSIEFPTTTIRVSCQQDLAEHKYYGVDGARVESTGRSPLNITVEIPLINGIAAGPNESWARLYPDAFRALITAVAERKIGTFQHPELGEITCKARGFEFSHDAQIRNGVMLSLQFVETIIEGDDGELAVGESPVAKAISAVLDLEASDTDLLALIESTPADAPGATRVHDLRTLVPAKPGSGASFEDVLRSVSGAIDRTSAAGNQANVLLNRYQYHLERVERSAIGLRDVRLWPVVDASHRARESLRDLDQKPPTNRAVLVHRVKADTTLPLLLLELPRAKLLDVVRLNPRIMATPVVESGTDVRYFEAR